MPIYSHSQLSTYEECPLKYKLCYLDKIKRDVTSIENFLGLRVHETLRKCYEDIRLTKLDTLEELLSYYDNLWQRNWHDGIIITKKDLTQEHYQALGRRMIETFYNHYAPFDSDITIGTEMRLHFTLGENGKYRLTSVIDRLSRTKDGTYRIHDYKTSAYLPSQEEVDSERQLALYQIAIQQRWPDIREVKLIWHYLAFDRELVSSRSQEEISALADDVIRLIDKIESAQEFPPQESGLCEWCEYPDLCPMRKHFYFVESLPANEYLNEPGVSLVNKYVELKEKAAELNAELSKVKEAIIDYAKREGVAAIKGSTHQVKVKIEKKLKFPGKSEPERAELDETIIKAGKWLEVSELDRAALLRVLDGGLWDKKLIEEVMKFGKIEETSAIYLSKLEEGENEE